ncbi:MAG: bifunctional ornithine acetyltransferase/N-acetylglutamate synthase [Halobacteriales archaeon]|nr:bifunctional ornithine acetyltransferase/N-acetylglutamate synthase [Halobacteriales archaeon]
MKTLTGNIGDVQGIRAVGVHAGLKLKRRDLALIFSEVPASAAAVYTTNKVQAAPIAVCKKHLKDNKARGIVVNSGCANACTGPQGLKDAHRMAKLAALVTGVQPEDILVASTGVIGQRLPMDKVEQGIEQLAKALSSPNLGASEAIMTTDTVEKQVLVEFQVQGRTCRLGGIAKGSGMIHPNMATMLGFLATDCAVEPKALQRALRSVTQDTFNMITVDGDRSTNDMVAILANGLAGNKPLTERSEGWDSFLEALTAACTSISKQIARDGEGAERLIEVQVRGAKSVGDARKAAMAVAGSSLVKAAMFGRDPNWGRILAALGYSGCALDPTKVNLVLANGVGQVTVFRRGKPVEARDETLLARVLASGEVKIKADLNLGASEAKAWGCDLTYDYVKINAKYTT